MPPTYSRYSHYSSYSRYSLTSTYSTYNLHINIYVYQHLQAPPPSSGGL